MITRDKSDAQINCYGNDGGKNDAIATQEYVMPDIVAITRGDTKPEIVTRVKKMPKSVAVARKGITDA